MVARPEMKQQKALKKRLKIPSKSYYGHATATTGEEGKMPSYMEHAFLNDNIFTPKAIFDRDGFLHRTLVVENQLELSEL